MRSAQFDDPAEPFESVIRYAIVDRESRVWASGNCESFEALRRLVGKAPIGSTILWTRTRGEVTDHQCIVAATEFAVYFDKVGKAPG